MSMRSLVFENVAEQVTRWVRQAERLKGVSLERRKERRWGRHGPGYLDEKGGRGSLYRRPGRMVRLFPLRAGRQRGLQPAVLPQREPDSRHAGGLRHVRCGLLLPARGGAIFGHYGDKLGRKTILVLTLLIMGVATFLIGVLPTYQSVGVLAPILLVVLRALQGIAVGGEWGGAALLVVEHAPSGRRGFYGSWPQMGSSAGLLIATGLFTAMSSLPEEQFLAWGWRVPFLLSIVLVVVGLVIRLKIAETPAFQQMKETGTEARMPIVDAVRTYPKSILLVMGMRVAENACGYIFTVFVLFYVTEELGLPNSAAYAGVMIAAA